MDKIKIIFGWIGILIVWVVYFYIYFYFLKHYEININKICFKSQFQFIILMLGIETLAYWLFAKMASIIITIITFLFPKKEEIREECKMEWLTEAQWEKWIKAVEEDKNPWPDLQYGSICVTQEQMDKFYEKYNIINVNGIIQYKLKEEK